MPDSSAGEGALLTQSRALALAEEIIQGFSARKDLLAGAESCTAGLISGFLAAVPGASNVFWGSFISYTVDAKIKMLGVPEELIRRHGAVSRPAALAMAEGALAKSGASLAFSVTGLAGPGGDGISPVGTVWIALAGRDGEKSAKVFRFQGSRGEVREAAALAVLEEVAAFSRAAFTRREP